ncbi:hypothetical protein MJO52_06450 [Microbulbifer variabilis]|uniref:Rap1a immunity protein domain-containing protein n=1 Tax=Microbulbifer variabilis TaxID=266805 RepID=A0ABY4VEN4_9GAMM|nr:Rap1a/Tai family immunity protein [Microbulbifer variabilis]USD22773.1 hypothetical protein MJO52_06450 [Microbulbifer variabilis]
MKRVFLFLFASLSGANSWSGSPLMDANFVNAKDVYQMCSSSYERDAFRCKYYLLGVYDSIKYQRKSGEILCMKGVVNFEQLKSSYLNYSNKFKYGVDALEKYNGAYWLDAALISDYPCPKTNKALQRDG